MGENIWVQYIKHADGKIVTAGSLAYREPPMDGVVTHVGKGDGTVESFREAQP